jgi:hypothetical protein
VEEEEGENEEVCGTDFYIWIFLMQHNKMQKANTTAISIQHMELKLG